MNTDQTTQKFVYRDQLKIVAEIDGAGKLLSQFVYGNHLNVPEYMIRQEGGARVFYRIVSDHLGSPRAVVNVDTGVVVLRVDYDEFGVMTERGSMANQSPRFIPFGFAGGLYDPDTGLVRFGARDYDPLTGRWTTKDPILFWGGDIVGCAMNPSACGQIVEDVGDALGESIRDAKDYIFPSHRHSDDREGDDTRRFSDDEIRDRARDKKIPKSEREKAKKAE